MNCGRTWCPLPTWVSWSMTQAVTFIGTDLETREPPFFHCRPVSQMRELERDSSSDHPACARLAIVGRGRLGTALARGAADGAGYERRSARSAAGTPRPDADAGSAVRPGQPRSPAAAALIAPGPLVGHCSGATGARRRSAATRRSRCHPLMTVTADGRQVRRRRARRSPGPRATGAARSPAARRAALGMRAVEVADEDRAAYHAAASIASNFLVTLEAAAERLAASAGVERELLVPLVRATVENWAALGPERALTGPVARGDEATVAAPARRGRSSGRPSCCRCSTRWSQRHPRAARTAGATSRMRTIRTVAELRAALRRTGAPAARSGSCRRWARSTRATCR